MSSYFKESVIVPKDALMKGGKLEKLVKKKEVNKKPTKTKREKRTKEKKKKQVKKKKEVASKKEKKKTEIKDKKPVKQKAVKKKKIEAKEKDNFEDNIVAPIEEKNANLDLFYQNYNQVATPRSPWQPKTMLGNKDALIQAINDNTWFPNATLTKRIDDKIPKYFPLFAQHQVRMVLDIIKKKPHIINILDDFSVEINNVHYSNTNIIEIIAWFLELEQPFLTEDPILKQIFEESVPQESSTFVFALLDIIDPKKDLEPLISKNRFKLAKALAYSKKIYLSAANKIAAIDQLRKRYKRFFRKALQPRIPQTSFYTPPPFPSIPSQPQYLTPPSTVTKKITFDFDKDGGGGSDVDNDDDDDDDDDNDTPSASPSTSYLVPPKNPDSQSKSKKKEVNKAANVLLGAASGVQQPIRKSKRENKGKKPSRFK